MTILRDIRFWIVFFFVLRIYGITFPPLEVGHNWRQTDGLMIARNFYESDSNILFPRVDVAGDKTGIVGCEFPVLNYAVYLISAVAGYEHWYGRLIVLVISSIGIIFFYRLISKYFNERIAFNASIVLLVSLWFSYSRKFIPDAFSASLCFISLYYALTYLEAGKLKHLVIFFTLALIACLEKILAATILTVLIIPMLNRNNQLNHKIIVAFSSVLILAVVCWWYFIWVPYLNTTYQFESHFFMGMSYPEGLRNIMHHFPLVLKRFYSTPFKYVGSVIFIVSVFFAVKTKRWLVVAVFAIPFFAYLMLLVKTGASVIGDHYYLITVIPCMAFMVGYGLSLLPRKIAIIALVVISVESLADQVYDFRIREPFRSLSTLEGIMDEVSQRGDLIAINSDDHNPTPMYFAHRRGWTSPNNVLSDPAYLENLTQRGCKYIVIIKEIFGDLDLKYEVVHDSKNFKIYRINER